MPTYTAPKVELPKVQVTVTVPHVSHYAAPKHEVADPKKYEPKHDYDQGHEYGKGGSYEAPKHEYKPVEHNYKSVKHEEYRSHETSHASNASYQYAHTGNVSVHNYQPKHDYDASHNYYGKGGYVSDGHDYGKNDYRARDHYYQHRYDERDYNRGVRVSYHYNEPAHMHYAANTVHRDCDHAYNAGHGSVSHVSYHYAPVHQVVYQPVVVYVPVTVYQPAVHHASYVHHAANYHQHGYVHHASTHGYAQGKAAAWRVKAVFAARHTAHYASMNNHSDCDRMKNSVHMSKSAHHVVKAAHHVVKVSHHTAKTKVSSHVAKTKDCGHMAARSMVRHHA